MICAVWDILCISMFITIFSRSVKTDQTTRLVIRIALWLVGLASLLGLSAPIYGWEPDWVMALVLLPQVILQFVMSRNWTHGVPLLYIKNEFKHGHRRKGDTEWT